MSCQGIWLSIPKWELGAKFSGLSKLAVCTKIHSPRVSPRVHLIHRLEPQVGQNARSAIGDEV
jgi:hypothetical protein